MRWIRRAPPFAMALVALMVALSSVGFTYTLWADKLEVNGTVKTGEVNAEWSNAFCAEFHNWFGPGPLLPGEFEGKDVGKFTTAIGNDGPNGINDLLTVSVTNVYPSYVLDCETELVVKGTIPVKIRGIYLQPGAGLTNCTFPVPPNSDQNKKMVCDQLTVLYIDGVGSQLHPGDIAASSLRFHVEQAASEDFNFYQFHAGICVGQWNEEPVDAATCFSLAKD